jgi:hypothetical protein
LDAFSLKAKRELLAAFPEWSALVREERGTDGNSYLVIQVAPPQEADVEHGLHIHTDNSEVTVAFDCYHSHFDSCTGDGDHFCTLAAISFVQQLLSERIAVVSWWLNETWRGSAQIQAGTEPEASFVSDFNRVRIRSWRGTFNADRTA